jgi:nucleoside-diphosphate-sugar epimerase
LLAEKFDAYHKQNQTRGTFVFLSAEPSILPLPNFEKYAAMKLEAENYLKTQCENLDVVVLRPGLVYSQSTRSWTVPMGIASSLGASLLQPTGIEVPPGTKLSVLADFTVRGLQQNMKGEVKDRFRVIGAKEMN